MNNATFNKLKQIWWRLPIEFSVWWWALASYIPGHIGEWIRRATLSPQFEQCGKHLKMADHVTIHNPSKLKVGDKVVISQNVFISAGGGISIGNHTLIGPYAKLWSVNHIFDSLDVPIWEQGWNSAPVIIGGNVWIATGVIILPGIVIGEGSIIGAGAVITKDVPPYSIVVGNPGRVIGSRNKEDKNDPQT